eukprot:1195543-Prorocentrum_minimum.AAC.3
MRETCQLSLGELRVLQLPQCAVRFGHQAVELQRHAAGGWSVASLPGSWAGSLAWGTVLKYVYDGSLVIYRYCVRRHDDDDVLARRNNRSSYHLLASSARVPNAVIIPIILTISPLLYTLATRACPT